MTGAGGLGQEAAGQGPTRWAEQGIGHLAGRRDVGQMRGAADHPQPRPGDPDAITAPCGGGVAGSSAPAMTSVGAVIEASNGPQVHAAIASQQPA